MGNDTKQIDTTYQQTKASAPGKDYLVLDSVATEVPHTQILLVIPLPYFQELRDKILMLNTICLRDRTWRNQENIDLEALYLQSSFHGARFVHAIRGKKKPSNFKYCELQ